MKALTHDTLPNTESFTVKRRYLTEREVERLMEAAKSNRHGHRDATMVLVAYRHGFRASEVCDLQWHQIELDAGRLHVRRVAKMPFAVHPHMLRHACGFKLANDGHDTRALQHYLGHKNIQHTVRYTELSPDRFRD